ncbi:MAG: ABC transporter ATP-binding protein [Verrucomicrobia bacterium]|nr:ABC transporter ATP-binding protein [Verrucomicrobiota bacterium]
MRQADLKSTLHSKANPPDDQPFKPRVILDLGKRYITRYKSMVAIYILATVLCRPLLPIAVGLNLSELTNFFQQEQASHSQTNIAGSPPSPKKINAAASQASRQPKTARLRRKLLGTYLVWLLLSVAFVVISGLLRYLTSFLDGKMTNAMRIDTFNAILRQSPEFFFEYDADRLTMVVNQFCNQAQLGIRQLLLDPLLQISGVIIAGWTLYDQLVKLQGSGGGTAWISFSFICLFALISPLLINSLGRFLQRESSAVQKSNLQLATLVGGAITASEEIQAIRAENAFGKKHADLLAASLRAKMNQNAIMEKLNVLNSAPGTLVLAALLGTAVYLVFSDKGGNPGSVVALALITPQFMSSIQLFSGLSVTARMTWPGLALVASILARQPRVSRPEESAEGDQLDGTLAAVDVTFSYPAGTARNVLDGVSFEIPAGQRIGLVARPGQGKTTFFRLALRFYEPQGGKILLGGQPISQISLATLRTNIVLMSQFPGFFHDTIRENFRIANPQADDDQIAGLCGKTGLWEILRNTFGEHPLDQQFDAGGRLSGGQRKLFALTRCLLRDPRVLLLDEPTTGMGPLEKYPLIDVMQQACTGRTAVLVDHDIVWQSKFCERILVLNDGKIIQAGTPQELRGQEGLFRRLYNEAAQQTSA